MEWFWFVSLDIFNVVISSLVKCLDQCLPRNGFFFFTLLGGWLRFDKMQCILGDQEFSILFKQSTMKNKLINHALSSCEKSLLLATQTTHLHCPSKWIACIFQLANEALQL